MKTVHFVAEFTGRVSSLPNGLRFKPPIPVKQGVRYCLEIDEANGATKWFEEPEKVADVEGMAVSIQAPKVMPKGNE